ncbi:DUF421 domain-containing protein [Pasteuria penetrans]|uniref:DUF421 domain-containing protein n=1 Tax=Pasteuria penetrans TaxID=86005 RepID=UPI0011F09B1A|nr:DUF421 domain-containing protein [Pasteuria penetrans]
MGGWMTAGCVLLFVCALVLLIELVLIMDQLPWIAIAFLCGVGGVFFLMGRWCLCRQLRAEGRCLPATPREEWESSSPVFRQRESQRGGIPVPLLTREGSIRIPEWAHPPLHTPIPIIVAGKVQDRNLQRLELNRFWLKRAIQRCGYRGFHEIASADLDFAGGLRVRGWKTGGPNGGQQSSYLWGPRRDSMR